MSDINSSIPIRTENPGDVIIKVADATTPSQQLKVNADGSVDTNIRALSSVTDSVTVTGSVNAAVTGTVEAHIKDGSGNAFSEANPLPVSIEESPGVEVSDYHTSPDVALNASVNHEYSVTAGKTLVGESVFASGSGRIKAEVKVETAPSSGVFISKFVGFNSTANPNILIPLGKILKQVAGAKIRVTITNLDKSIQDVYSTFLGIER